MKRSIISPKTQDSFQIGIRILRDQVRALPNRLLRRVVHRFRAGEVKIGNREGIVRVVKFGRIVAHQVRRSRCQGMRQPEGGAGLMANNLAYPCIAPNVDPRR